MEKDWKELKNVLSSLLVSSPVSLTTRALDTDYRNVIGHGIPYQTFGYRTLDQCLDDMTDILQRNGNHLTVCVSTKSAHIDKLVTKQTLSSNKRRGALQKRTPAARVWRPTHNRFVTQERRQLTAKFGDASMPPPAKGDLDKPRAAVDGNKQTESTTVNGRLVETSRVPLDGQRNLSSPAGKLDGGTRCGELPVIYRSHFDTELNHVNYGYKNLLLFDSERPPPADDRQMSPPLVAYPADVLGPFDTIRRQFDVDGDVDELIEVCVAEVYHPGWFYVMLAKRSDELDELMDQMQLFYCDVKDKLRIPANMLSENLWCVTSYEGEFHRARVARVVREDVKVFCFDYGTYDTVHTSQLYYLHRRFMSLPQQSIETRLAGIKTASPDGRWTLSASQRLLELARDKYLFARVHKADIAKQRLDVFLVDTNGSEDFHLNDQLVEEGFAEFENRLTIERDDDDHEEAKERENRPTNSRKELLESLRLRYGKQT